jgi:hypothetical protein
VSISGAAVIIVLMLIITVVVEEAGVGVEASAAADVRVFGITGVLESAAVRIDMDTTWLEDMVIVITVLAVRTEAEDATCLKVNKESNLEGARETVLVRGFMTTKEAELHAATGPTLIRDFPSHLR